MFKLELNPIKIANIEGASNYIDNIVSEFEFTQIHIKQFKLTTVYVYISDQEFGAKTKNETVQIINLVIYSEIFLASLGVHGYLLESEAARAEI